MPPWMLTTLVWGAALAAALVLAAWCTPRGWWRRPNLRALAVVAGGTAAFGLLLSALLPAAPTHAPVPLALAPPVAGPAQGARYRVADDLNLREDRGVRAARMRVLPAGTIVSTTGATDGDWWRVRAKVGGHDVEGWASSLWLRRTDEGQ
ncbi:SH3 domain-containing protein [Massilia pinisoli]|uniref:SH3 domain-containing protein n=1 Tax=Massilia pinisoli TaxID=1772194 RepID=A0ABT1ZWL5_9BURK|nr:SH3 domain-containing protein [Massilia pinisoli]MCS0584330.1 SH3 domain-containing protein [Massilia pinisoli]